MILRKYTDSRAAKGKQMLRTQKHYGVINVEEEASEWKPINAAMHLIRREKELGVICMMSLL